MDRVSLVCIFNSIVVWSGSDKTSSFLVLNFIIGNTHKSYDFLGYWFLYLDQKEWKKQNKNVATKAKINWVSLADDQLNKIQSKFN